MLHNARGDRQAAELEQICEEQLRRAEIKPGERTVIEYLLSPVQATVMSAGRER